MIPFSLQRGNKAGGCEDAPPLAASQYLVVCDGVGASGMTKHTSPYSNGDLSGTHTSAYFGARIVSKAAEKFFVNAPEFADAQFASDATDDSRQQYVRQLKAHVKNELDRSVSDFQIQAIPSKTLKVFPTTFASAILQDRGASVCVMPIWAGDSRVYALSPGKGLQLLTLDDALGAEGRMNSSSRMNNYVYHGYDFRLNYAVYELPSPCLILCCSDGCFDYRRSPLHFERALLNGIVNGMQESGETELATALSNALFRVLCTEIGDDTTLAGAIVGYSSISDLRESFRQRLIDLEPQAVAINNAINDKKKVENEKTDADRTIALNKDAAIDMLKAAILPAMSGAVGLPENELVSFLNHIPCISNFHRERERTLGNLENSHKADDEISFRNISKLKDDCKMLITQDYIRFRCDRGQIGFFSRLMGSGIPEPFVDLDACIRALEALQVMYIRQDCFPLVSWYYDLPDVSFRHPSSLASAMEASVRILRNSDCAPLRDLWAQSYYDTPSFISEREAVLSDPNLPSIIDRALSSPDDAPFVSGLTKNRILQFHAAVSKRVSAQKKYEEDRAAIIKNSTSDFFDTHADEILQAALSLSADEVGKVFSTLPELRERLILMKSSAERLVGIDSKIELAGDAVEKLWDVYRSQYELYKYVERKAVK